MLKSGSRRGQVGLRGVPGVSFDFGIQQRHRLPGFDHVADIDVSLDEPSANPKREIDLVACAQMAGPDNGVSELMFFDNDRADRADHRRRFGFFLHAPSASIAKAIGMARRPRPNGGGQMEFSFFILMSVFIVSC